jgi:hypothetical protein
MDEPNACYSLPTLWEQSSEEFLLFPCVFSGGIDVTLRLKETYLQSGFKLEKNDDPPVAGQAGIPVYIALFYHTSGSHALRG